MESSKPCAGAVADRRAADLALAGAFLPLDAVYEILLRLPGKDLCRLRAVCRLWRSLLSDDQAFAAAHATRHRHREPPLITLVVAGAEHNGILDYYILDLSGYVLKRVHAPAGETTVLNPATGSVCILPQGLAQEHEEQEMSHLTTSMITLGQVVSTGDSKVLRVRVLQFFPNTTRQLYEIITLDHGGTGGQSRRWRRTTAAAYPVVLGTWAAIEGIVYFFSCEDVPDQDAMPALIASFDLETEDWRPAIRGPPTSGPEVDADGYAIGDMDWGESSLLVLNGSLVVAHRVVSSSMDLWFLMDAKKGFWVRKHIIQLNISHQHAQHQIRPLYVLNDGRIVLMHIGDWAALKIYNPRTSTCIDVAVIGRHCVTVGLYTGSVLSLSNGAN